MKSCIALILIPIVVWGYCPPPYSEVGSSCIYIATEIETNQYNASQWCHTEVNGELAAILTPTQHKAIVDFIYSSGLAGLNFWIDGKDEVNEGIWVTSKGLNISMGTPFWAATNKLQQPDNAEEIQHCLWILWLYNYYMDDIQCTFLMNFICETPVLDWNSNKSLAVLEKTLDEAIDCPIYFTDIGGKCLSLMTWAPGTWESARESCIGLQGELAAINDPEQLRALYLYIHQENLADHSYWLGGTDAAQEGTWVWLDGSPVPMSTPFWGIYESENVVQEPQGATDENCLGLIASGGHYFRDVECNSNDRILTPLCQYTQ